MPRPAAELHVARRPQLGHAFAEPGAQPRYRVLALTGPFGRQDSQTLVLVPA